MGLVTTLRPTLAKKAVFFQSLINVETMKILVATEKPFAKAAVDGIREIIEGAGYELALLEKYADKADLLAAVSYKVMQQHPSAALVSVNDNVLLADNNNVLIIPLKKKGTYHVEYNQ